MSSPDNPPVSSEPEEPATLHPVQKADWAVITMRSAEKPSVPSWIYHFGTMVLICSFIGLMLSVYFNNTAPKKAQIVKTQKKNFVNAGRTPVESPCADCIKESSIASLFNRVKDIAAGETKVSSLFKKEPQEKKDALISSFKSEKNFSGKKESSQQKSISPSKEKEPLQQTSVIRQETRAVIPEMETVKQKLKNSENSVLESIRKDSARVYIDQEVQFGEVTYHFRNASEKGIEIYVSADRDARKTYYYPKVIYGGCSAVFENDILTPGKGIYGYIVIPEVRKKKRIEMEFSVVGGESGKQVLKIQW